ncbi:LysR substrate-binding domain-containing protein [Aliikangiella coralliicola]|uniref:LysR family transcriptional regulator n=1 Tax=Aliikangiella coralliicola TaxID=2592383 RepID=A0A545U539_9GAMM|nr:LysR substrate-binding domain-containing protein [Aliikangiella coralliicola]TQV84585.1 LysR family transcriptional regulator [Aliikangiella coralliicola]
MKLHQLKYLVAIVENNFNITTAAEKIYTSQPGISKQLRLLEDELDLKIFERSGKQLIGLTALGEDVVKHARRALQEVENIKRIAQDKNKVESGSFSLATTQTQAKYVLPEVFKRFHARFPNLQIDLQHGSAEQMSDLLDKKQIDFAIASDNTNLSPDVIKIPCYHWDRVIVFPQDHPLGDLTKPTIEDIAKYPIITYKKPAVGESSLVKAMKAKGLQPNIVFTARDADVIKTYVRNGLGIGIIASMAFNPRTDQDLIGFSAKNILPRCTTWIAFNKNLLLRRYMYSFIELFAPHITREWLNGYVNKEIPVDGGIISQGEEQSLPMHRIGNA